jgi:type I restriction-modification system DNA methylase subunit
MQAPEEVVDLVKRFDEHSEAYRSGALNETQVRIQFINPLLQCLGWDVDNRQGYAEAYKEVVHEDKIKIGSFSKAPDYSIRIGGTRKFFLEAKKPSVNIKEEPSAAFQLRRYAWSAKLPLSILTDFEELAVYDCRIKPQADDKPSVARVIYLTYLEYLDKWDEIANIFSKTAILKGSFDKYAASTKLKRGTAEVDEAFLKEIEQWRDTLARNLALRNNQLDQRQLNFAVQATIDRIIFLRICEDRGLEPYGQLIALQNGTNVYQRLLEIFRRADDRYNSGLFYFKIEKGRTEGADALTPVLNIDDSVLKSIIGSLYYPDSPYEFSVLPADILGQVYEQFLGRVIRLTVGHRAVVEDKFEVKKAGGVYYTPTIIVDHVVDRTVRKLLEGKTPKQADKLRILDPACGSGSFLLAAYQCLLDWYRDRYAADPQRHRKVLYKGRGGDLRLTSEERKRILLNSIFGVDIDSQAVEVSKLSLLLKVLEGESDESLRYQYEFFRQRALPDLAANIKCGNALIASDFYSQGQIHFPSDDERFGINAFDWDEEFPSVIKRGGFDVVIGNPPWGQKAPQFTDEVKQYLRENYPSSAGIVDLFRPFVERAIRLTAPNGVFGMVLPDIVLLKDYQSTRCFLLENLTITNIDWWGMAFANAVIDAATIIGRHAPSEAMHLVSASRRGTEESFQREIRQADFWDNPRQTFNIYLTPELRSKLQEIESKAFHLGEYFEVHEGVHSGNMRSELFVDSAIDDTCKPLYFGREELRPHFLSWAGKYIRLSAVPKTRSKKHYANVGRMTWHQREKVLVRRTGDYVLAAVDQSGYFASNNFFLVFPAMECPLSLDGLSALLNSRLLTWYFRTVEPRVGRVFAELKIKHLTVFPIPRAILNSKSETLNTLGSRRRVAAEARHTAQTPQERTMAERLCRQLDSDIEREITRSFDLSWDIARDLASIEIEKSGSPQGGMEYAKVSDR